jgi:cyclopropane fatty-acyl-phospholipid synthase-like methyltransferase
MVIKITQKDIRDLVSPDIPGINSHVKDEMAIPTYLHSNPLIRWLFWKRHDVIANLATIGTNDTVLDFGCGTGVFLPTLCQLARKVYAMDLFPQYAQNLVNKRGLKVDFIDNLSKLPDDSIDVIIAADVLEHLNDVTSHLRIFTGKLRSKGRLIVSGPTETRFYKFGRWIAGFGEKGDYHLTNINELTVLIENNGYQLLKTTTLPFSFRLLPSLFKIVLFAKNITQFGQTQGQ